MKFIALLLPCLLGLPWFAPAAEVARPNIIIFLPDDLGACDLGCYGSTFYDTPNLDRLAVLGMRLTQAYAACPGCSPTRASLPTDVAQRRGRKDARSEREGKKAP